MQYFVGLVCVLALGVVGCGDEAECQLDTDCDDQNECTQNACAAGLCDYRPVADGTACDHGNECTASICINGACSFTPVEDGTTCSAGRLPGRCADGRCKDLCEFLDCDDGNECTFDSCERGSCHNVSHHDCRYGACEAKGEPGVCVFGVCEAYPCNEICDDANLCTWDSCECNPGHVYYGTCTFFDSCRSTQCAAAACDPAVGECVMTPRNEGKGCACYWAVCLCPFGTYRCVNGSCVCTW